VVASSFDVDGHAGVYGRISFPSTLRAVIPVGMRRRIILLGKLVPRLKVVENSVPFIICSFSKSTALDVPVMALLRGIAESAVWLIASASLQLQRREKVSVWRLFHPQPCRQSDERFFRGPNKISFRIVDSEVKEALTERWQQYNPLQASGTQHIPLLPTLQKSRRCEPYCRYFPQCPEARPFLVHLMQSTLKMSK
jgi:hypothetical protein